MTESDIILFLLTVKGIGSKTILKLFQKYGSFQTAYDAGVQDLQSVLSPGQLSAFLEAREKYAPSSLRGRLKNLGIRFCSILDIDYPGRLLAIPDAPPGIFVKGKLPARETVTASVIGSRRNSYYGEKQTKLLVEKLVEHGIEIVSGMARGIDGIAQLSAIRQNGRTYGVLGCGVNICYPPEHQYLFEQIPKQGGLISEYLPFTPPLSGYFPARNRIISGLGDVLIVMEARLKSGTLITVDMALEQGKEVFVLPGRIDDPLSIGRRSYFNKGYERYNS